MRNIGILHLVVFLFLAVVVYSTHSWASEKDGLLKVYFLNVGQGDAIFIETPSGNQILIDGGPDDAVLSQLGKVMPFHDRDIDMVILTHGDADHSTGLIDVLERYDVAHIVQTNAQGVTALFQAWQDAVTQEGALLTEAVAGTEIDLGNGVVLRERDAPAFGRPRREAVHSPDNRSPLPSRGTDQLEHEVASLPNERRYRPAVGRPGWAEVKAPIVREPPLVLPVALDDEDLRAAFLAKPAIARGFCFAPREGRRSNRDARGAHA